MHDEQYSGNAGSPDQDVSVRIIEVRGINAAGIVEDRRRFLEADPVLDKVTSCLDRIPLEVTFDDGWHMPRLPCGSLTRVA
jgi:hypothetical protein